MEAEPAHPIRPDRREEIRGLWRGLALLLGFLAVEIFVGVSAHSLALLSDAAHMLTDALALAVALLAAHLVMRPAGATMTFGLGRAEILSAQANAVTMLVLAGLILYGAIVHLIHPLPVQGWPVVIVAVAGIVVNLAIVRLLGGHGHGHGGGHGGGHRHAQEHGEGRAHEHHPDHSLNVAGSLAHITTDLIGFIATAIAGVVILTTGFRRADAIVALLISGVMIAGGWPLLKQSVRVMMEAAPAGLDPSEIGLRLAARPGVSEVHDLHVWEVTSGFPALSAHIVVDARQDCHQLRAELSALLAEQFGIIHTTLQVEHAPAPLQIEVSPHA
ncbi:cation diffusion facilitator family transporter [Conexibacter sp. DBS9H8]|uniref:cation diffusion facilitator family transporter n=1 Tax=Conexibacter sp. DBS9H8 TaxID=2937801 RepID=UPI00200E1E6E|nr:cation diffusion facilitator family transporter [Conexibacter sp. DBS9H8]